MLKKIFFVSLLIFLIQYCGSSTENQKGTCPDGSPYYITNCGTVFSNFDETQSNLINVKASFASVSGEIDVQNTDSKIQNLSDLSKALTIKLRAACDLANRRPCDNQFLLAYQQIINSINEVDGNIRMVTESAKQSLSNLRANSLTIKDLQQKLNQAIESVKVVTNLVNQLFEYDKKSYL